MLTVYVNPNSNTEVADTETHLRRCTNSWFTRPIFCSSILSCCSKFANVNSQDMNTERALNSIEECFAECAVHKNPAEQQAEMTNEL